MLDVGLSLSVRWKTCFFPFQMSAIPSLLVASMGVGIIMCIKNIQNHPVNTHLS